MNKDTEKRYFEQVIDAKSRIDHYCDGPMTLFVAICRAIRICDDYLETEGYNPVADALLEVMQDNGWTTTD